jgi:hypothetical protein
MSKPLFYQISLLSDTELNVLLKGCTLSERMGSEEAKCEICGKNKWLVLPKDSELVREGGKAYIECLNCGMITHL